MFPAPAGINTFHQLIRTFFPPSPALLPTAALSALHRGYGAQSAQAAPCLYAVDYQAVRRASYCRSGRMHFSRVAGIRLFYPDSSSSPQQKAPIFPLYRKPPHHYSNPFLWGRMDCVPDWCWRRYHNGAQSANARSRVSVRTASGVFFPLLK